MFGQFFLVGQQILFQRFVFFGRFATRTSSSDRADGDFAAEHADQNFRACTYNLKTAKVEVEHER